MLEKNPKIRQQMDESYALDRDSFEPAYLQLVKIIQRQIADGLYRPGDRLPSEAELRNRYGISAMTVRRAINMLVDQDMVSTEQGRGTFVKQLSLCEAAQIEYGETLKYPNVLIQLVMHQHKPQGQQLHQDYLL